jgi:hypothetical protein
MQRPRYSFAALRIAALCLAIAIPAQTLAQGERDPINTTCPKVPNWSEHQKMQLTLVEKDGVKVLLAEGVVDRGLPERLQAELSKTPDIAEIWLRSPGGNARAGNAAGRIIREQGAMITRVPTGWTCFSACNFVFMGGRARIIDPGGNFMVHMFTLTGDRDAIDISVLEGTDSTIELIGDIEQESALLASEDNDFLIRMGVSRKLLTEVMYRQKAVAGSGADRSTRRCLTLAEALEYNVANVAP